MKGAPHLNIFLYEVPSLTVSAGFIPERLPVGMNLRGGRSARTSGRGAELRH